MVGLLEPAGRHRSAFEASDDRALPIDNCRSRSTGIVPSRATVRTPAERHRYVRSPSSTPGPCVRGWLASMGFDHDADYDDNNDDSDDDNDDNNNDEENNDD